MAGAPQGLRGSHKTRYRKGKPTCPPPAHRGLHPGGNNRYGTQWRRFFLTGTLFFVLWFQPAGGQSANYQSRSSCCCAEAGRRQRLNNPSSTRKLLPVQSHQLSGKERCRCQVDGISATQLVLGTEGCSLSCKPLVQGHEDRVRQLADGQAVLLGKVLIASGSAERSSQLNSSLVITSNRPPQDWITLFPDPVMANSALDRLSHHAQHLIMEGESYRKKLKPKTSNPSTSKGAN